PVKHRHGNSTRLSGEAGGGRRHPAGPAKLSPETCWKIPIVCHEVTMWQAVTRPRYGIFAETARQNGCLQPVEPREPRSRSTTRSDPAAKVDQNCGGPAGRR